MGYTCKSTFEAPPEDATVEQLRGHIADMASKMQAEMLELERSMKQSQNQTITILGGGGSGGGGGVSIDISDFLKAGHQTIVANVATPISFFKPFTSDFELKVWFVPDSDTTTETAFTLGTVTNGGFTVTVPENGTIHYQASRKQ